MKKKLFVMGLLVSLLTVSLIVAGCDGGSGGGGSSGGGYDSGEDNPFFNNEEAGRWYITPDEYAIYVIFDPYLRGQSNGYPGFTYTYTGKTATATFPEEPEYPGAPTGTWTATIDSEGLLHFLGKVWEAD